MRNLDIFGKVGKAMAHDEYIPFTISDGMLEVQVLSMENYQLNF